MTGGNTSEQASELGPEAHELTGGNTSGPHTSTFLSVSWLKMDTDQMPDFFVLGEDSCFVLYRVLTFDLYPLATSSILFLTPPLLWQPKMSPGIINILWRKNAPTPSR